MRAPPPPDRAPTIVEEPERLSIAHAMVLAMLIVVFIVGVVSLVPR